MSKAAAMLAPPTMIRAVRMSRSPESWLLGSTKGRATYWHGRDMRGGPRGAVWCGVSQSVSSWVTPKARKGQASAIAGRGLFALEPIAAGEVVAVKGGHIVDTATMLA